LLAQNDPIWLDVGVDAKDCL